MVPMIEGDSWRAG